MKKFLQRPGPVAATLLGLFMLWGSFDLFYRGLEHNGSGFVDFPSRSDPDEKVWVEVSEAQYRRRQFTDSALGLFFAGVFIIPALLVWRERDQREASWKEIASNPANLKGVLEHPENYADDYKDWLRREGHLPKKK